MPGAQPQIASAESKTGFFYKMSEGGYSRVNKIRNKYQQFLLIHMQETPPPSYRGIHQYTYFDSATKKYLDQRRKNQVKKEQNRIEKERKQLAKCTFRPAIQSKNYYQITKKTQKVKDDIRTPKTTQQPQKKSTKELPYQRLLNWGTRKQLMQREKFIQRQVQLISLTKSLSKEKQLHSKLNKSLQDPTRSVTHFESSSIKAVPVLTRQQLQSNRNNYRTIHSHNKSRFYE